MTKSITTPVVPAEPSDTFKTIRLRRSVLDLMDEIVARLNAGLPATAKTSRSAVVEAALHTYNAAFAPTAVAAVAATPTGKRKRND